MSAALRAWAAGGIVTPWIAPDELIYADIGRSFWQTGHFLLWGAPVQLFSAVYPVLAGLPLSLHDRASGYELLKGVQAVAMSLTAIPVYLWAREVTPRGWALVAAVLALVPPSLAYSGLIMTEVAFYPVFVVAAWAVARAVALPTPRREGLALAAVVLACATRLQAVLFVPAYVTAVLVDRRRVRAHVPAFVALAVVAALWSAWQLRHGGPVTKVLGAYQAAGETGYDVGDAARFVLYHFGDLVLISGAVPLCALAALAAARDADENVRALVATTASLCVWTVLEVGVFASKHVGHLAERNLFPLLPLLAIVLVVWLARGAPRPLAAGIAALVCVALLFALPLETLTSLAATPSSFTQIPLLDVTGSVNLDWVVPLAALALLGACALLPARVLAVGVPALLALLGVVASVSASRFIVDQAKQVEYLTLGPKRAWIDAQANGPAVFLFAGQLNWETPWQARFWNRRLESVVGFLGTAVPGVVSAPSVGPSADGRLVNDRTAAALEGDYVVTSNFFTVAGTDVAHPLQSVVLWQADQPLRVTGWLEGVAFDWSVATAKARYYRYGCDHGGTLNATLGGGTARHITIDENYSALTSADTDGVHETNVSIPVRPVAGTCYFDFKSDGPFALSKVSWS